MSDVNEDYVSEVVAVDVANGIITYGPVRLSKAGAARKAAKERAIADSEMVMHLPDYGFVTMDERVRRDGAPWQAPAVFRPKARL